MLISRHRGPEPREELWLQVHRDIGEIAHQRRQRLLRHCTGNPQIQQGDVIIRLGRPFGRARPERHPEDGRRGRLREEGLLWVRSNVRSWEEKVVVVHAMKSRTEKRYQTTIRRSLRPGHRR